MELIVPDFVISQNLFQELGEDALPAFEEQIIVRRRGDHDDVSALLRLVPEIPCDDVIDYVHGLRSAAEAEDARIGFARIVVVWQHALEINRGSPELRALVRNNGLHRNLRTDP